MKSLTGLGAVHAFLFAKLGRCPRCMRLSLRVAALAWAGAAAVHAAALSAPYWYASLAAAAGLTSLWLTHILAFGIRSLGASGAEPAPTDRIGARGLPSRQLTASRTRRETLWLFVKGIAVAATASLAFVSPVAARCGDCGGGWHDCITHFCNTVGQACCPPGFPYLNHCDCRCYRSTSHFNCSSYSNCNYCY